MLKYNGFYVTDKIEHASGFDSRHYVRFYEKGTVIASSMTVGKTEIPPEQMARIFSKDRTSSARGKFELHGDHLTFITHISYDEVTGQIARTDYDKAKALDVETDDEDETDGNETDGDELDDYDELDYSELDDDYEPKIIHVSISYEGTVTSNALTLNYHSHATGHEGTRCYTFVPFAE